MRAAQLLAPSHIEVRDIATPAPAPGEVLIQTQRLGICGSDVSFYQGHRKVSYPHTLGHELSGHVTAVGDGVTKFKSGQRVPEWQRAAAAAAAPTQGSRPPRTFAYSEPKMLLTIGSTVNQGLTLAYFGKQMYTKP